MERKTKILRDSALNEIINEKGYVIIPFFDKQELIEKMELVQRKAENTKHINQNKKIYPATFHCTFLDEDIKYKLSVYEELQALFEPLFEFVLCDYKLVQANLFIKPPGRGHVSPHQNLTLVDEQKYSSVSIWCPLQDTTCDNGAVHIIPGSHRKFEKYRNAEILWPMWDLFKNEKEFECFKPINVSLGEVLIMEDSIVHYSPVNKSLSDRVVFHGLAAPTEAPILFSELEGETITLYHVADDFWQVHSPYKPVNYLERIGQFPYKQKHCSIEEIMEICSAPAT